MPPIHQFEDRVVIVTGGAMGIGAGCATVFANAGGHVAIVDRNVAAGSEFAARLGAQTGQNIRFYAGDVGEIEPLQLLIARIAAEMGKLDCLVNNAGVHPPATPITNSVLADVEHVMRVNFLSTYFASKAAVPFLSKSRGTIVNISSMTAVLGQENSTAYAASKGAQVSFTKSLAIELAPLGIRVNAILPSNIDTPLMHEWASSLSDPQSALDRVAKLQVLGRMGTPEEIGQVALFLASEQSSFITGQAIEADGGAALDY